MSAIITEAPARTKRRAIARPMPRAAPVTITDRPAVLAGHRDSPAALPPPTLAERLCGEGERFPADRLAGGESGRRHREAHGAGVRLRDRRGRHRRLPAGQPAERRSGRAGAAARGRRLGRLSLDPHPGRLPLLHRQPAHRLDVPDRARARAERPAAALSARPGARRLLVDQRHDLHARPGARLRRLGRAARRPGMVVGAGAAGLRRAREPLADGRRAPTRSSRGSTAATGELRVERQRARYPILDAFAAACRRGRASRRGPTSTTATTRAWATSRSTSAAACAGTRRAPSWRRRAGGRTSRCGPGAEVGAAACSSGGRTGLACTGVELCRRRARRRRGGRWCWRPGRSTARSSCSSRGSGPAALLHGHGDRRWSPTCRRWAATCRTTCSSGRIWKVTARRHAERARRAAGAARRRSRSSTRCGGPGR